MLGAATRSQAGGKLGEDPASPARPGPGDQAPPLPSPTCSQCWSGAGEARRGQSAGMTLTHHVRVDLDCSHQTVNGLWGEEKGGGET